MTKQQRLRNTDEGLMAGLVGCGFRGPARWSNFDWELPFMKARGDWAPLVMSSRDAQRQCLVPEGGWRA